MATTGIKANATDSGALNYHIQQYALAQGLGRLGYDLVVTKLITNYSAEAKNQGSRFAQNVRVPIRGAVTVQNKVAGTSITPTAVTSTKADIAISNHKTWDILVEDWGSLFAQDGVMEGYMIDGASAIAEEVEDDVIALYGSASEQIGTAAAGADEALLRLIRETSRGSTHLFAMNQPTYVVWGVKGEGDLLGETMFVKVNEAGTPDALRNASLGRIFGLDNYSSNKMPTVAGSPTAEHAIAFQRDAMGIAFVDMSLQTIPAAFTGGVQMAAMTLSDDNGVPAYSLRSIVGYDQLARGTVLSVDTMYGVGVVRSEHLIDVLV